MDLNALIGFVCILYFRPVQLAGLHMYGEGHGRSREFKSRRAYHENLRGYGINRNPFFVTNYLDFFL